MTAGTGIRKPHFVDVGAEIFDPFHHFPSIGVEKPDSAEFGDGIHDGLIDGHPGIPE